MDQKKASLERIDDLVVIGSNFTKADIFTRSRLAISSQKADLIYAKVARIGLKDFFLLSTCNRIEFYGYCKPTYLIELLKDSLHLTEVDFQSYFYHHSGINAIRHFFKVTSGLESQILGDYEIAGQVKKAIRLSREANLIGPLADRLANFAFQASKEIKNQTNLSNGKYSVSYAASELITAEIDKKETTKILIVGIGKMGNALSRNLNEYFPNSQLTLANRTYAHAEELARELNGNVIPFEDFTAHLNQYDAIITAAAADDYLIKPEHVQGLSPTLFLDLSVPQVIDPAIKNIGGLRHFSVDEISAYHNELMKQRVVEIPKAELIIEHFIAKAIEWQSSNQQIGIILDYKKKLNRSINHNSHVGQRIEKSFKGLIKQIKSDGYRGCTVLETVNDLMTAEK